MEKEYRLSIVSLGYIGVFIKRIRHHIKKSKTRKRILREWYETELSYKLILETTINHIRESIKIKFKHRLSSQQIQMMFPNFDKMLELSNQMVAILESGINQTNPNRIMIGAQLLKIVKGYQAYAKYFASRADTELLLEQLIRETPKEYQDVERQSRQKMKERDASKQLMGIKDYLETPFYRIFKYMLLIKDYLKNLPISHLDIRDFNEVLREFHEINVSNNNQLKKMEEKKQKDRIILLLQRNSADQIHPPKKKLNTLKQQIYSKELIENFSVDTIHFTGKLYLFDNFLIITKNSHEQKNNQAKEKFYDVINFNQFSYVARQRNLKYFKNLIFIIGEQNCIHFLMPDPIQSFGFFRTMSLLIKKQRIFAEEQRQLLEKTPIKKQLKYFKSQFRFELIGIELRKVTEIFEDVVYISRLMVPYYHEDQIIKGFNEFEIKRIMSLRDMMEEMGDVSSSEPSNYDYQKQLQQIGLKKTTFLSINQKLELGQKEFEQIKNWIVKKFPYDSHTLNNFKHTELFTEKNILKKTKAYELQKFGLQQFFNSIFRNQEIMRNPIWLLEKLKVNSQLWDYITERNERFVLVPSSYVEYGFMHCKLCGILQKLTKVSKYESLRKQFIKLKYKRDYDRHRNPKQPYCIVGEYKNHKEYCFNFFNSTRLRILALNPLDYDTIERLLLYYHYLQGRLDYPLIRKHSISNLQKSQKILLSKIYFPDLDNTYINIEIFPKSTVGEVIDEIGEVFEIYMAFDYELKVSINGKYRTLDRDGVMYDLVKELDVEYQKITQQQYKKSHEMGKDYPKPNIFTRLKKAGSEIFSTSKAKNHILFIKTTYLHKSLEKKSWVSNPKKCKFEINQIFYLIKLGVIKLSDRDFIEYAALYYCFKHWNQKTMRKFQKITVCDVEDFVPNDKSHLFDHHENIKQQIKKMVHLLSSSKNEEHHKTSFGINSLQWKILSKTLALNDFITYYSEVQCIKIPQNCPLKSIAKNYKYCLIGVNYRKVLVTQSVLSTEPIIELRLKEIQHYVSMYSLFINHDEWGQFRFDGKMVYDFHEILRKYKILEEKFPQHIA